MISDCKGKWRFWCGLKLKSAYIQKQLPEVFWKKRILKYFSNFTWKHLCWIRPETLLLRDSNTGVFLWNLLNFSEYPFWRRSANICKYVPPSNQLLRFNNIFFDQLKHHLSAYFGKLMTQLYRILLQASFLCDSFFFVKLSFK